jgi:hypothetical protein
VALATLTAVVVFIVAPPRALAVLADLEFGYGGTLGFMLVSFAPLLTVGAIGLVLGRPTWLPLLGVLVFNLVVWYPILLFLVPMAGILLGAAYCFRTVDKDAPLLAGSA